MKTCLCCNVEISNHLSYCSISCSNKITKRRIPKPPRQNICLGCGLITSNLKYCSNTCQGKHRYSSEQYGMHLWKKVKLKNYLIETRSRKCEKCLNTHWNGDVIPIDMDHIDGDSANNDLTNLRLLCPNCHAQTLTYKGKNKGRGRAARKQRYQDGKTY